MTAEPPMADAGAEPAQPSRNGKRIIYDGLNLALSRGTGIATYTRMLANLSRELGYDVGAVFETPFAPPDDAVLHDVLFFDQVNWKRRRQKPTVARRLLDALLDRRRPDGRVTPVGLTLGTAVETRQFAEALPRLDRAYAARDVFMTAGRYFNNTGKLTELVFERQPDILHCTYAIPVKAKGARNIYTIHDLVPLRLPHTTLDNKRAMYRLLKAVAAQADHIVTVSESSKRDIIELLGVDERRITNTYQAVSFPTDYLSRPDDAVANYLSGLHGLDMQGYLLFFGALEPKKNVGRLIDAYLSSGVALPLVLVSSGGWQNEGELDRLKRHQSRAATAARTGAAIHRLEYLTQSNLVNLIRGARAVVFPSLMEGFGLPVLEAMTLGAPVITSARGALAEVAGEAGLLVDPYDVDEIARAISTVAGDRDLCRALSERGRAQAARFSYSKYRERARALYAALT